MSQWEMLLEAAANMQLIQQRQMTRGQKTDVTRIALIEDHLTMVAKAVALLLTMRERGL